MATETGVAIAAMMLELINARQDEVCGIPIWFSCGKKTSRKFFNVGADVIHTAA